MTSKIRFGAALLIVSAMTCGTLGASPLGHRAMLGDDGSPALTAFVDWVSSLFSWSEHQSRVRKHPGTKVGAQIDPDGNH
jgi:hypothetical protein